MTAPLDMQDLSSSSQGLNPCPLHWKRRVLTTRPPGKSREINFNNIYHPISRVLFQLAINIKLIGTLNVSVLGLGNLVCVCYGHCASGCGWAARAGFHLGPCRSCDRFYICLRDVALL